MKMEKKQVIPDTKWDDDEIVMSDMTPDTDFVFRRMTEETIAMTDPRPGEEVLDVACGRAIDALSFAERGAATTGIEPSPVMIEKALEFMEGNRAKVTLLRSLAEDLPFPDDCFDKVVCKGAMDHFADIEDSMAEMARVTRPGGKVIIAIANFESLTCRLGRFFAGAQSKLFGKELPEHPFWAPPGDHNFKFDLELLRSLIGSHCRVEEIKATSLMWGYPGWGGLMKKAPPRASSAILRGLDAVARMAPSLSDVLVARGSV